jgi:hypothetical protein
LGELERVMTACGRELAAYVIFVRPAGADQAWVEWDLWHQAKQIPGVMALADGDGVESRRFHAQTSGQALLYDPRGALLFQGGITVARGHAGESPGGDTIISHVRHESARFAATPVFGCELCTDPETK